jgi:hypothetical protein
MSTRKTPDSTDTSFWMDLVKEDLNISPPKPPEPPPTRVIGTPVKRGYGGFCNE